METLEISNEVLVKLADSETTEDVKLLCESGQRLFASRHLQPGWVCNGDYYNPFRQAYWACNTYNNLQRSNCRQCNQRRNIKASEFATFATKFNG